MTRGYRYNKARRERLRSEGRCIDCFQINTTVSTWRCRACRIIASQKQIARYHKNKAKPPHPVVES